LINNNSFVAGKLNITPDIAGQSASLLLKWGDPLNIFVTIALLIFSGWLFYLGRDSAK
jgi:hypothetical protein